MVDGLPTGLIPIGSVQAGGNFVCQVLENPVNYVSCLGDLAADDEVTITIPVFITADGGVLDNEACADPDHVVAETNELDNCAHALTQVGPAVEPANLSIDKTASTGSVTAGQEFTYTVAVSNIGGTDATGTITMTDDLPPAVELMGVNPASGWSCPLPLPATPNHLECTRTGLAAGSTENIVISVKTKTGADAPTTAFTNHAEVSGNSEVEFDEVIVGVGGAGTDLLISDITDTPDPVNRTKELTWTIVAVNAGTADADGAVVRVQLPDAGVTVSGIAATNGFNCVVNPAILPAGMTYDCTAGVVTGFPASSDTTITVVATVNLDAPAELVLTATADPANAFVESDEVNNTLTQTTTVRRQRLHVVTVRRPRRVEHHRCAGWGAIRPTNPLYGGGDERRRRTAADQRAVGHPLRAARSRGHHVDHGSDRGDVRPAGGRAPALQRIGRSG